jgi:hypothetical protein
MHTCAWESMFKKNDVENKKFSTCLKCVLGKEHGVPFKSYVEHWENVGIVCLCWSSSVTAEQKGR